MLQREALSLIYRGNRNCTALDFTRQYQLVLLEKVCRIKITAKVIFILEEAKKAQRGE